MGRYVKAGPQLTEILGPRATLARGTLREYYWKGCQAGNLVLSVRLCPQVKVCFFQPRRCLLVVLLLELANCLA